MKKRAGSGDASNEDLIVKPPDPNAEPLPPPKGRVVDPEEARGLHERAMNDVRRMRAHRNETLKTAVWAFLKSVVPVLVALCAVFGSIAYDASLHKGTWRETLEYFIAIFGMIFSLFIWAWARR